MNIKLLFLTITIIAFHANNALEMPMPQDCLKEIMHEHFNRRTTDQDLVEARDAEDQNLMDVLIKKILLAPGSFELLELLITLDNIKKEVMTELEKTVKNNDAKELVTSLLKLHESNKTMQETIMANSFIWSLQQENSKHISYHKELCEKYTQLNLENIRLKNDNSDLQNEVNKKFSTSTVCILTVGVTVIAGTLGYALK